MNKTNNVTNELFNIFQNNIEILNKLGNFTSNKISLNENLIIKTDNMELRYQKRKIIDLINDNQIENDFKIGSLCQDTYLFDIDCMNTSVISQLFKMNFAFPDFNNSVSTSGSQMLGLSLFNEKSQELSIQNRSTPFELTIARDPLFQIDSFKQVNLTTNDQNLLWLDGIITNKSNLSIHYQFKTNQIQNESYLGVIKFKSNPNLDKNEYSFDLWKIFCPNNNLKFENNEYFYELFSNMSHTIDYKGNIGIGLKLLNLNENNYFCLNNSSHNLSDLINNLDKETKIKIPNIYSRVILSGCYYIDPITGSYSSNGLEILETSNLTHIKCISNHLTQFASGWITLPSGINFNDVFANASFIDNITIYLTIIIICLIYILLFILTRYKDKKDKLKLIPNITLAEKDDIYFYEIIFYTGNRMTASTKSNILFKLYGDCSESRLFTIDYKTQLQMNHIKLFQSGSIDSFIISAKE